MLQAFNARRIRLNLPWSKFWLFKEDIKTCFPQMDMSPESAVLLAMRLTATVMFIHLVGSFGWTGAPMAWAIIGSAMLRICVLQFAAIVDIFLICDDFVGFGLPEDTKTVASFVRTLILDVCGPGSVSVDKTVWAQQAEVIGWYIDLLDPLGASIRPKTDAIYKMCYYFYSFNINLPQPLILWQILHSFAERYSQGLRGLRCFVAAFAHMIRATGPSTTSTSKSHNLYVLKHQYAVKKVATASTKFAIVIWRIVSYQLFRNVSCFSVPIDQFLAMNNASDIGAEFDLVSDASPYRICSAIYLHGTKTLLGWTSVLLPFEPDTHNRYQGNREYLGLLTSLFLTGRVLVNRLGSASAPPIPVKWINDNKGALAWADDNKTSSINSMTANMAVVGIQVTTNISLLGSEHLPGIDMGDIDHESRREEHLIKGDYNAPSLIPSLFIDLEKSVEFMDILVQCSPSNPAKYKVLDFHDVFLNIHARIQSILPTV
jgi:hypothetical protein